MHDCSAVRVGAKVKHEPELFDGETRAFGHEVPFGGQALDDLVDDGLAEENHAEPAEGRHIADLVGELFRCAGTGSRVGLAEGSVVAERKDLGRLGSFLDGLGHDHGREAAVGQVVKVSGDGVEQDEIVDVKELGDFQDECRVIEECGEHAELTRVELVRRELAFDPSGWR